MRERRGRLHGPVIMAALAVMGLCGCGEPLSAPGAGALVVPWEVLPMGCQQAGLEHVRLTLLPRDGSTPPSRLSLEAPCAQGVITLKDVDYGAYTLKLEGLSQALEPRYLAQPSDVIVIQPEATRRLDALVLTPKPSTLDVIWRFEDGALCGAHGVDEVEVMLFDQAGYMLSSAQRECALGHARFEGLKAGAYSALVRAGEGGAGGMVEVELEVAKQKGVEVMLRMAQ